MIITMTEQLYAEMARYGRDHGILTSNCINKKEEC
jgi:hypothetical protein